MSIKTYNNVSTCSSRLIRRKRSIETKGQILCPKCNIPLRRPKWEEYKDFGWCSRCKDWYYLRTLFRKLIPHKIIKEKYFGEGTTEKLRQKMAQYLHHFQEEMVPSMVKIYTSDKYDQKFLQNKIPKR